MRAPPTRPERRSRRFVVAAMHSPFTLPVLAGSMLASVALGIHLGESAIAQINPIYYQAPPLHPRDRGAAIEEGNLARAPGDYALPTDYAGLHGWDQGQAALAADCGDCAGMRGRETRAYSARVPYFGSRRDLHAAVAQARDEFAEPPQVVSPPRQQVDRYAHYAVTVEAPRTEAPVVAQAVVEEADFEPGKDDQK